MVVLEVLNDDAVARIGTQDDPRGRKVDGNVGTVRRVGVVGFNVGVQGAAGVEANLLPTVAEVERHCGGTLPDALIPELSPQRVQLSAAARGGNVLSDEAEPSGERADF